MINMIETDFEPKQLLFRPTNRFTKILKPTFRLNGSLNYLMS